MRLAGGLLTMAILLLGAPDILAQEDKAWLGVELRVVEPDEAKQLGIDGGLRVLRVDEDSPAERSGLEVDDIVLSAGEEAVTTIEAMVEIMSKKRPGDMLNLGVRRDNGRTEPLMVTLGSTLDKDAEFGDDAKVKELRERLRELDAERRKTREQLEKRLQELRAGQAHKVTEPAPESVPEVPEPKVKKPERTPLKVSMGASFVNLDSNEAAALGIEGGIRVTRVREDSAAEEAGLEVGDVVVAVDAEPVTGTGDLRIMLSEREPGDLLEIELIRDGERVTKTLTLRPKSSNSR